MWCDPVNLSMASTAVGGLESSTRADSRVIVGKDTFQDSSPKSSNNHTTSWASERPGIGEMCTTQPDVPIALKPSSCRLKSLVKEGGERQR